MSESYPAPKVWADIARTKQRMQIDLLTRAQAGAHCVKQASTAAGMTQSNYLITCRRLGVPVDHLLAAKRVKT